MTRPSAPTDAARIAFDTMASHLRAGLVATFAPTFLLRRNGSATPEPKRRDMWLERRTA